MLTAWFVVAQFFNTYEHVLWNARQPTAVHLRGFLPVPFPL